MYHGMPQRGSASLNLLGGQREIPPDPIDVQSFTIAVNNVSDYLETFFGKTINYLCVLKTV